ncbi:hypothetical protein BJX99DRAFT_218147 [Aspergillus californicus]
MEFSLTSKSPQPVWTHPFPLSTPLEAFRRYINKTHSLNLQTYKDIHRWSVTDIDKFSLAVWTFCGIKYSIPPTCTAIGLDKMWPPPTWFPQARLNFTENILAVGLASRPDGIAVTAVKEGQSEVTHVSFRELERTVAIWAATLKKLGVGVGDRVATVLTNSLDALVILLAVGSLGAIFSSTAPDMGVQNIVDRYVQVRPKVFVCETAVRYAGKNLDLRSKMAAVSETLMKQVPELQITIIVRGPAFNGEKVVLAEKIILDSNGAKLHYEQLPFDHPIYILYSSGTTGKPKCICHAAGRALLQQKKELILHQGMGINSVFYQYTTTGWMMWNYAVAGLSVGARLVIYDGSPLYPDPLSQLRLIEQEQVTHWGTSPKYLSTLRQHGVPKNLDLSSLHITGSSGSPLGPEMYYWFYEVFPATVGLFSGSGGTDLVGGSLVVLATTLSPVYPGEIAEAGLGIKAEIWDKDGNDISASGQKGDLVITKPFFSMPITFWGPDGHAKYQQAYFDTFPGIWYHGDFAKMNPVTGGFEILGRSDGVLNPGGVRFGTAEIYSVLDRFTSIQDYIAVAQKLPGPVARDDERVLLFIKMLKGELTTELVSSITSAIRRALSPRHVPAEYIQVKDIPYTLNGKRMENLVRDIVAGHQPSASTVANPECLEEYTRFRRGQLLNKL